MTTPPKASKFHIRRTSAVTAARAAPDMPFAATDDGFGDQTFPTSEQDMVAGPGPTPSAPKPTATSARTAAEEIAAIETEGLTGKQLRMARRVAQKNGIEAASDFEAIRLLRRRGIDPFQRSNVLQLVNTGIDDESADVGRIQLPQTVAPMANLPATQVVGEAHRAAEIMRMQRDIVRRRRRNFMLLMVRLAVFVFLPALMTGWYFYTLATPLYATRSEFLIQQAEAQGGLAGMFQGTQFATAQDSITVQSYLQSRDAMLRLDLDLGYKAHFSQDFIDPLQRLDPNATNEAAYKLYSRNVKIGYDPTEGIIKMEVIAADPLVSQQFSQALIRYAEEQVDQLTQRLRADQMQGARDSFDDAEAKMQAAQGRVLELQEKLGVIDPLTETNVVMSQVSGFESQLQQKRLQLQALLDNAQPNQARVDGAKADIARLEELITTLRAQLTDSTSGSESLARISGQLRVADADLQTRQAMLSQAMQQLETARIEANRQVRYLSVGVSPVAPDEATYPRAFENTILAFLIFGGIYLMLSLTAAILREQVTS